MKALVITHVFPRWQHDTQAVFLLDWAKGLAATGVDVRVLAPHDRGAAECEVLEGIPVRRLRYGIDALEQVAYRGNMHQLVKSPLGALQLAAMSARTILGIRSAIATFAPDVIHVHWWLPSLFYVAKANTKNVPVVAHIHGTDVRLAKGNVADLMAWSFESADRIEAVSQALADEAATILAQGRSDEGTSSFKGRRIHVNTMPVHQRYIDFTHDKTTVEQQRYFQTSHHTPTDECVTEPIPQPVWTTEHESAQGAPVHHVLAVGRLVKEKGFIELIHAVSQLPERALLRIIGEGPLRPELANLAAQVGVTLELPGTIAQRDMLAQYAFADVVVQPSHGEGFGMVAAEAALCLRPVVATDTQGARDALPYHALVPVGEVAPLREAIWRQLTEPDAEVGLATAALLRERLAPSAAAQRTVEGWATIAAPYPTTA